ncbi:MAG: hypothetical protein JKY94_16640 [Rhodobacteraceae bacterium]|nr:hypothetical protein [Paracoccaceae bacterium]
MNAYSESGPSAKTKRRTAAKKRDRMVRVLKEGGVLLHKLQESIGPKDRNGFIQYTMTESWELTDIKGFMRVMTRYEYELLHLRGEVERAALNPDRCSYPQQEELRTPKKESTDD